MIIKSTSFKSSTSNKNGKSRNNGSFTRIMSYLEHDKSADSHEIYHNFRSRGNKNKAQREFYFNDSFRKKKNNNSIDLLHEICSFNSLDKEHINIAVMRDLAEFYINKRAKNSLAYCKFHLDSSENPHFHIVISQNQVCSSSPSRISKKEFSTIKKELEAYQISKYPELKHSIAQQGIENTRSKNNDVEKQIKKRTNSKLQKEKLSEIVNQAISHSKHIDDLKNFLAVEDVELYFYREKPSGVIIEGANGSKTKKYRWATLNIEKDRIKLLIAKQKEKDLRIEQLKNIQIKNDKSINKGIER